MRRLTIAALVVGLIGVRAFAQGTVQPTGAVQGQVFIKDADGGRSVVPATKIALDGPTELEAESDNKGNFALSAVPAGSYRVTANTPGMTATQGVVVTAGAVSQVQLEMKLEAVTESTTVMLPVRILWTQTVNPLGPTPSANRRSMTCPTPMSTSKACCRWFQAWCAARTARST